MDSEGKQDCNESSTPLGCETVQEPVVNVISPASNSYNLDDGIEALTQLVRKMVEEVFEISRLSLLCRSLQRRNRCGI
ncbi:hypothetical protein J1N35_043465 [Gossypium stocksii]|uniref:Uncharacterized protein n=1 Tax=Gossypium stocksii TaxID=47602 RepID=A0A9D3U7H1_9ROSI|nr:hypothetical protein J1N35_043465 [Gossypium stocksii]